MSRRATSIGASATVRILCVRVHHRSGFICKSFRTEPPTLAPYWHNEIVPRGLVAPWGSDAQSLIYRACPANREGAGPTEKGLLCMVSGRLKGIASDMGLTLAQCEMKEKGPILGEEAGKHGCLPCP